MLTDPLLTHEAGEPQQNLNFVTENSELGNATNMNLSDETKGYLSIYPGDSKPISGEVTECLQKIQEHFPDLPLWIILHDGNDENKIGELSWELWQSFYQNKNDFSKDQPILILVISPGGDAESAYRIAKLIRNKCGSFSVLIPFQAKSAATLLSLGAEEILIGREADLGPLDVQIGDMNEERTYSGLDEVQSIDGLFDFANNQVVSTTILWSRLLRKKKQVVFPAAIDYVAGMMRPLMEKIDTVHYMALSRTLRIAEEYAFRLLLKKYGYLQAKIIAKRFVENYPNHGFIIDLDESNHIGLKNVYLIEENVQALCDSLLKLTKGFEDYLIGKFYLK